MVPSPNGRMGVDEKRNKNKNEMGERVEVSRKASGEIQGKQAVSTKLPCSHTNETSGSRLPESWEDVLKMGVIPGREREFNSPKRSYGVQRLMMIKFQIQLVFFDCWLCTGGNRHGQVRWNWPCQSHKLVAFQSLLPYATLSKMNYSDGGRTLDARFTGRNRLCLSHLW